MHVSSISNSTFSLPMSDSVYVQGAVALSAVVVLALAIIKCNSKQPNKHEPIQPPVEESILIKKWAVQGGSEVQLVKQSQDLHWIFLEKVSGRKYTSPAINDAFCYETYSKDLPPQKRKLADEQAKCLRDEFQKKTITPSDVKVWLRDTPLNQRVTFFKDCDIEKVIYSKDGTVEVNTKLCSLKSRYGQVSIDRDNWAVTVVCRLNKSRSCRPYGHSVIVYEGVRNGEHFIHWVHMTVDDQKNPKFGVIEHYHEPFDQQKDLCQSQTWRRSSQQVIRMTDSVDEDIENQAKGKSYVYSSTGGHTIPEILWLSFRAIASVLLKPIYDLGPLPDLKFNCQTWIEFKLHYADIDRFSLNKFFFLAIPTLSVPLLK